MYSKIFSLLLEVDTTSLSKEVTDKLWRGEETPETDRVLLEDIATKLRKNFLSEIHVCLRELIDKGNQHRNRKSDSGNKDATETLFSHCSSRSVSLIPFVVLLRELMNKHNEDSFHAAIDYLLLLQLDGSNNYFHPFAFRSVLNLLKTWQRAQLVECEQQIIANKAAKRAKRKQKPTATTKPKRSNKAESHEEEEEDAPEQDEDATEEHSEDKALLDVDITTVATLLKELVNLFAVFNLDQWDLELKAHLVEILVELTRGDSEATSVKSSKTSPASIAYDVLGQLLHDKHGAVEQLATLILKSMLANILMYFGNFAVCASIPKFMLAVRQQSISFVKDIVATNDTGLFQPLHTLLQQLCARVPEKAEYRSYACDSVNSMLQAFPESERCRFVKFLQRYSKNEKATARLFAVELACTMLCNFQSHKDQTPASEEISPELMTYSGVSPLLEILIKRSSDKVATVRAKALSCLAICFEQVEQNEALKSAVSSCLSASENIAHSSLSLDKVEFLALLRRRVCDAKTGVRKSALQVLEVLGQITPFEEQDLCLIMERCLDTAVSIRKQAISCLTSLLRASPTTSLMCVAWVHGVLPLIMDPETTVQDRCLDYFEELLLQRIIKSVDGQTQEGLPCLLNTLTAESTKYVQQCCSQLAKQKRISKQLIKALQNCISNAQLSKGCWMLLAEVAPHCPQYVDQRVIINGWNEVKRSNTDESAVEQQRILRVLECTAEQITSETATSLAQELLALLKTFQCSPLLIQALVKTLVQLYKATCKTDTEASQRTAQMCQELLHLCDDVLAAFILPRSNYSSSQSFVQPVDIIGYLFTVGELAQICPSIVPSRLVTVIQALIAPGWNDNSTMLNDSEITNVSPAVRAFAFVALGKLCLEDFSLAKKCIPAFARELEVSPHAVIRNNIMVLMCDFCIKYTSLVDKYIPNLALCLRDPNEIVRRQTVMLLSRLLQEDFVKWKGSLFYRFLFALVDDVADILQSAKFLFVSLLKTKSPLMFFTHFIETLFHLNDYKLHKVYNQFSQSERERALFNMAGADNRRKRMAIYTVFLSNMTDEQKFQTIAKLCQEVLAAISEGTLPLDASTELLNDTLTVLGSKDIKLASSKTQNADEEDEQQQAVATAKDKLLSKIVKKNVLENIVPIIIELKRLLEKNHSPLLRNLMEYLKELLKDFKDEVSDILVADNQLAKEIQYDMRRFNAPKQGPSPPSSSSSSSMMSPRKMFSPKTASPRQEVANFSVPRLRPSTPRLSIAEISRPLQEVANLPALGKTTDIVHLQSPEVQSKHTPRKWQVDLERTSTVPSPLSFEDDENETRPEPRNNSAEGKATKTKGRRSKRSKTH